MHFYVYVLKETFSLLNMYIDIPIQYLFSRHFLIHFIFKNYTSIYNYSDQIRPKQLIFMSWTVVFDDII